MYKFEDFKHGDVESFIVEFGYGECHSLSHFLALEYNLDIGIIKSFPSEIPLHSFVFLDDKYAFDAHGIDTIENTIKRYETFAAEYDEDTVIADRYSKDEAISELSNWCTVDDATLAFVKAEFNHLDSLTHIKDQLTKVLDTKIKQTDKLYDSLKNKPKKLKL